MSSAHTQKIFPAFTTADQTYFLTLNLLESFKLKKTFLEMQMQPLQICSVDTTVSTYLDHFGPTSIW